MNQNSNDKVLKGNIVAVFFSYAIPAILGLLSVSSAGIIDGMFIGNYAGETALAAATLSAPVFSFIFGIAILFSTGGEVFSGKFIGEKNYEKASDVFSKVMLIIFITSITISILGLTFIDSVAKLLGANSDTHKLVVDYLRIIIAGTPVAAMFSLSYFVRVDGKPNLSSAALVSTAVLNIVLDYIFIVRLNWGIQGAAWGTILAHAVIPILLLPHFLLHKGKIVFQKPTRSLKILGEIIYNGSSEFLSEISGGILFFIINRTMLKYYGTYGVAAFAIVGYLLFFTTMISYAISDSIKSLISINFGANQKKRVYQFLRVALITVFTFGVLLIILTQIKAEMFASLFLESIETKAGFLSSQFLLRISPALPIIGVNIILSAYFTAVHDPKPSLIISLLRTLMLPIIFIPLITLFLDGIGVIVALIASETVTLLVALILLKRDNYKRRGRPKTCY